MAEFQTVRAPHRGLDSFVIERRLMPAVRVRVPAHQDQLLGLERQRGSHRLRQVTQTARQLPNGPIRERAAVDLDRSAQWIAQARDQIEKRALPCPVTTHQSDEFPWASFQADRIQNVIAAERIRHAAQLQLHTQRAPCG